MSGSPVNAGSKPGQPMPLATVFAVFLRIGLLSFGGPAAQIALMHRVLVDERKWLDDTTFLHALSFCMLLPGPEAMQLATWCGWRMRGVAGGLIAGSLFVIPGAIIIAMLATVYALFGQVPVVAHQPRRHRGGAHRAERCSGDRRRLLGGVRSV